MRKSLSLLLVIALLVSLCSTACAEQNNYYVIEDSDTRYLTYEELWDWQYEAIGYIYNEIFARHGRGFRVGQKYDVYFSSQAWYSYNPNYRYGLLNSVEIANEQLAHSVLKEMRAKHTTNSSGKRLPRSNEEAGNGAILNFRTYNLKSGQKLAVYSAPSQGAYRAANGKAAVSTNGPVQVAGKVGGWLLIQYTVKGSQNRIGYVSGYKDKLNNVPSLSFYDEPGEIIRNCSLTDDPMGYGDSLLSLSVGDSVTILCPFAGSWTYIEVDTTQGLMRGFVPDGCVSSNFDVGVGSGDSSTDSYDWDVEGDEG